MFSNLWPFWDSLETFSVRGEDLMVIAELQHLVLIIFKRVQEVSIVATLILTTYSFCVAKGIVCSKFWICHCREDVEWVNQSRKSDCSLQLLRIDHS